MSIVRKATTPYWVFYQSEEYEKIDNCGKWMHFFDNSNYQFVKEICAKAIEQKAVTACKHTSLEKDSLPSPLSNNENTGVICFYLDGKIIENHKLILDYMIHNNLIQKNKLGKLLNIGFKFDEQTRNNEYGDRFIPHIKLGDFIDLNSGKFLE